MRIAITGGKGLLGSNLARELTEAGHYVLCPTQDITEYDSIVPALFGSYPDIVLHCAAYTRVDRAEIASEEAFLINAYGTENIAVACSRLRIPMLYMSTEAVFDGTKETPYTTWDTPNPISVYGRSKYAGELAVQRHLTEFYILRTNLIYGHGRSNFATQAIDLCKNNPGTIIEFPVIDQRCTPTYVKGLVEAISQLIETERWGVYHYTDSGETTRAEVAQFIGNLFCRDYVITQYTGCIAQRGRNSLLDCSVIERVISRKYPNWKDALREFIWE